MKKSIQIEIILYGILILLGILSINQLPYTGIILVFYGGLLPFCYPFLKHWHKDEKSIALKIIGFFVMSFVPISFVFIIKDYPGKDIITIAAVGLFIVYWAVRFIRKTQTTPNWYLYLIFQIIPLTYLLIYLFV